jgi:hypothetical protein
MPEKLAATSRALPIPKTITGGCLCGEVRFRIDFSPDHDWKRGVRRPRFQEVYLGNFLLMISLQPHTCQCTQCRKNCGSLVYNFHTVTASELTWLSKSTYTEYNSSPGCYRAFCKNCGSTLGWTNSRVNTDIELAVGTFDEEFLLGGRDNQDHPLGAYGIALANPDGDHFHTRNEIKGVTEVITSPGTRFWKGSKEGPLSTATDQFSI